MSAVLVLEDETFFTGYSFGKTGLAAGEVVFNTCMTGYQEIITDPSYNGQIVTMTYPLIGNYGFNTDDNESYRPHVEGLIVKELCDFESNWRKSISCQEYFKKNNIIGIQGIDTRAVTQHIRRFGSMFGIISTESHDINYLIKVLKEMKDQKRDLVREVSTKKVIYKKGRGKRIVLVDFGVKYNIIRELEKRNCEIIILPALSRFEDIIKHNPDGILLSNGPGDPMDLSNDIPSIKRLIQTKKPILGICLGHQLLGIALGGKTYKLKLGHHGGNHAVKDLRNGKCYITSQNHNYALYENFNEDISITHINVNDRTVEGFMHNILPVIGIQYHVEASPGPTDSSYIFDEFLEIC